MSIFELFTTIFTFNILTFGGGMLMFPLLEQELVQNRQLLSPDALLYSFAVARVTPGQANLYVAAIGFLSFGVNGAILATLAIVIPSFLMIPVMKGYEKFKSVSAIKNFVKGLTVAAVGLIAAAIAGIGLDILTGAIPIVVFTSVIAFSKLTKINGILSFSIASFIGGILFLIQKIL